MTAGRSFRFSSTDTIPETFGRRSHSPRSFGYDKDGVLIIGVVLWYWYCTTHSLRLLFHTLICFRRSVLTLVSIRRLTRSSQSCIHRLSVSSRHLLCLSLIVLLINYPLSLLLTRPNVKASLMHSLNAATLHPFPNDTLLCQSVLWVSDCRVPKALQFIRMSTARFTHHKPDAGIPQHDPGRDAM